ncbi:MAG: autotransporter outer membrane beta-barrel domain-containing protein [Myxococcales bacterium]|nr:autotransporter outer membrane beta-barrel domain-containing protein [Myxococcales bacterium]
MSSALTRIQLACYTTLAAAAILPGIGNATLVEITTFARPQFYDDLERASARANQSVFDTLGPVCGAGGCTPEQQNIFEETRELVHTANEILGTGPTLFSLGVDDEGLGNALRWTAAEEVSAEARASTDFSNGQRSSVNNRITALRFGATGFSLAGLEGVPLGDLASIEHTDRLGPAGASQTLSKLGGFFNTSYGLGTHDPTTFEDAFDFVSFDVTFGVDYRFLPDVVAGLVAGYSATDVDFDASKSIVDGGIESEGFSIGAFGMYTWKNIYLSSFLSYQRMEFDIDRFITYPSLNPDVEGTNTQTRGDTHSDAVTVSVNTGYTYRFGPGKSKTYVLEPSLRVEYTHITIAGYNEGNVDADEYFALRIAEQTVESLELTLGLRTSAAVSTRFGVFFPFARLEWRFELEDATRQTSSQYSALGNLAGGTVPFGLDSEPIDQNYGTLAVGVQIILKGGRQRLLGGAVGDRLSIYSDYRTVFVLDNISNHIISGGLRYTF